MSRIRYRSETAAVVLALVGCVLWAAPAAGDPPIQADDALIQRELGRLATFTGWLERNGVSGYVGEVGWPDDVYGAADAASWNTLGERWYAAADAAGLWATQWATGQWWGTDYRLAPYESSVRDGPVNRPNTQAQVIERHLDAAGVRRGVALAGAEFGAPGPLERSGPFSNRSSGRLGDAYTYDPASTFSFLRSRGVRLVRFAFRWERIQPRLGRALARAELGRLRSAVSRARDAGIDVILDVHNYGDYWVERRGRGVRRAIGTDDVPVRAFADLWRRLSRGFGHNPTVIGYGLGNEPVAMPSRRGRSAARLWEIASQRATAAIRGTGDRKLVLVQGYEYAGVSTFPRHHPDDWIRDPAHNIRYEAHQYFDSDGSGTYRSPYARELESAQRLR